LQAVVTKYSFYKEGKSKGKLPGNFLRHNYDLYCLLELEEVKKFIGTIEYENYKKERFRNYDTIIKNCDGFILKDTNDRTVFKSNYAKSASLYYKGQIDFYKFTLRVFTQNFFKMISVGESVSSVLAHHRQPASTNYIL
jgi:hypothetical protein